MGEHRRISHIAPGLLLCVTGLAAMSGCDSLGGAGAMDQTSVLTIWTPPTPAEAVAMATDKYNADNRYRGLSIIANAPYGGEPAYLQWYEVALSDEDAAVRTAAVRALARHGEPRHVPMMVDLVEDEDPLLRWETVRALQRLHHDAAVGPLLGRLDSEKESRPDVRAASATALGQYAEARVVDGLIQAINDRELIVNKAARDALRTLTGQDLGYDVRAWVEWKRDAPALFAGRGEYEYPAFKRDATWWEVVVPWMEPPNEEAGAPVGLTTTVRGVERGS